MGALLFFVMAAISTLGVVSWCVFAEVSAGVSLSQSERNQMWMDNAVAVISAAAYSSGGITSYPAENADGSLPTWLGVNTKTPWGAPYRWCAYGSGVGGSAFAANGYSMGLVSNGVDGFVLSSDAPPVAYVAGLLISALPNRQTVPACSAVSFTDGSYTVSGGSVRAISSFRPGSGIVYVSPLGGGNGSSPNSPETLAQAVSWWSAAQPAVASFVFASGSYAAPDFSNSGAFGATLTFVGNGATISGAFAAPEGRFNVENLTVTGGFTVYTGSTVTTYGAAFSAVTVDGAAVLDTTATSMTALTQWGGDVHLEDGSTVTGLATVSEGGRLWASIHSNPTTIGSALVETNGMLDLRAGASVTGSVTANSNGYLMREWNGTAAAPVGSYSGAGGGHECTATGAGTTTCS